MKLGESQERYRLARERAMTAMTPAQKKSEENLQAELDSLGQQMEAGGKLISEDALMLASNMDDMTQEPTSNQERIE